MSDEAMWRRLDSGIQGVSDYIVPLSKDRLDGEGMRQEASAIITAVDQQVVVLTSFHCLTPRPDTTHVHGDGHTVRFTHDVVRVNEREDLAVEVDAAHMLLSPHEIEFLRIRRALDLTRVPPSPPNDLATEWVVIGFPRSRSDTDRPRRQVNTEQIVLVANEASPEAYAQIGASPDIHVLLRYDIERVRRRESPGESLGVHPKGMSGGGIFIVGANNEFELVAIQTHFSEDEELLVGTRLPIVIESLRKHYSHLGPRLPKN